MKIAVYTFAFNEEALLPYFLKWYGTFADKIVVYDNQSTDCTAAIAGADSKVELRTWDTNGKLDHIGLSELKNTAWKESRDYDWVFVVDVDEFVFHPDMAKYLSRCQSRGYTYLQPQGFDMVADHPPHGPHHIFQEISKGVPSALYSKPCVFNPRAIEDMGYGPGAHTCEPTGHAVYHRSSDLKLLHYHQIGKQYLIQRYRSLAARKIDGDDSKGFSTYEGRDNEIRQIHTDFRREAVEVISSCISAVGPKARLITAQAGGTNPVSATGDPHISTITGANFLFTGEVGKWYNLLGTGKLTVPGTIQMTGRIAALKTTAETIFDAITIKTCDTVISVATQGVTVNGQPVTPGHRVAGGPIWVQPQYGMPDRLIAFGYAGWLISVFRDPGTSDFHRGGPLQGVEHLAVYGNPPTLWLGATGLLIDGSAGVDPAMYQA